MARAQAQEKASRAGAPIDCPRSQATIRRKREGEGAAKCLSLIHIWPFTTHPRLTGASVPVLLVGKAGRIEPFVRELHRKAQSCLLYTSRCV